MESSLHNVADLPVAARSAVEALVGHPLQNDQVVYIATLEAKPSSNETDRNAAWAELESIIAQMQQHAAKSGLSSDQMDGLVDAESAAVRSSRKR